MIEYFLRRLMMVVPVVLGVSLLVFFMIHLIPGDPVVLMLGESSQPADVERLRHDLGLDQPVSTQLVQYFSGLITFDLGHSLHKRVPVTEILMKRFPATLALTVVSMVVAILLALPLGILSAVKARSPIDTGSMFFALLGVSLPNFWLGPMLILLFSIHLNLLPVSGRGGPETYILPAITLGTALSAILTRMIRSSLLEVLQAQYVTTAYAKGLSATKAVLKHALRNALIPVVTILGLQFGALLGGSIITETIFSWPGVGRELIQAIQGRDYPVVQGCVLIISFSYVFVNLITDLVYGFLDPRIQYSDSASGIAVLFNKLKKAFQRKYLTHWIVGILILLTCFMLNCIPDKPTESTTLFVAQSDASEVSAWITVPLKIFLSAIPLGILWIWLRNGSLSSLKFMRRKSAVAGLIITLLFFFLGIFGPDLAPQDPVSQDLSLRLEKPGDGHLMGMDNLGRDLFSRILAGTRISMYVGVIVTVISVSLGTTIGLLSGIYGGIIDDIVMRIVDVMLAFPGILLAIAMVAILGPDINNVIIALCIMGWVGYARLVRGQVLSAREEEYVVAAKSLGAGKGRIMFRHILPNIAAPIIVQATLGMAGVIIAEAGLSFLGLGVQPPTPSWGGILNAGIDFFREGPQMTVFPGIAIMIVVLGLNFLGDGLRDSLDPKTSID